MSFARHVDALVSFAVERETIRIRKEAGVLPFEWTQDPILSKYRFCNIRRKDDRVSRWLIANVLQDSKVDYDFVSFMLFAGWCRWVNWPPTILAAMQAGYGPPFSLMTRANCIGLSRLIGQVSETQKAWTGAYMITAPPDGGDKGAFVSQEVVGKQLRGVVGGLVQKFAATPSRQPYCYEIWDIIRSANYWGDFMAGQLVADLTYTKLLRDAPDLKTWAPIGPGSLRGYNRVLGNEALKARPDPGAWRRNIRQWRGLIVDRLGPGYVDLTGHDTQNILCEFDKYMRAKNGEGRPRAMYKPETAF